MAHNFFSQMFFFLRPNIFSNKKYCADVKFGNYTKNAVIEGQKKKWNWGRNAHNPNFLPLTGIPPLPPLPPPVDMEVGYVPWEIICLRSNFFLSFFFRHFFFYFLIIIYFLGDPLFDFSILFDFFLSVIPRGVYGWN